jgi:hypothetical protein
MSSRRDFLLKTALTAGSFALPITFSKAAAKTKQTSSSESGESTDAKLPYKNTYVKNVFVTENEFRMAKSEIIEAPEFEKARNILPAPFWKGNEVAIDMYWKAWEIAIKNIRKPAEGSGFINSYIDTAYNGNLFMWDSSFITMFAKYGTRVFPFQKTLNNFYAKQHPDGFIGREIWGNTGEDCFHRFDPVSTGPNLLPWSELEYYRQFGDGDRIQKIFPVLCAYYQWLKLYHTWPDGSYWSSGWGTGMDNQPRVQKKYNPIFSTGQMSWIDTCLQQIFIAKILIDFGFFTERWQEIEDIEDEVGQLKKYVKEKMWDPKTAFFYDRYADGSLGTLKSIGAYWALWTDILNEDELTAFINHLSDKETFNRKHPIPSMPANHEKYQANGRYWQGGVWAPTNYMVIKGLINKNRHKLAFDLGLRHHQQVGEVFKKTGTFWEYYAPEYTEPGFLARPDFVGWTGLVPIAILIEVLFGIKIDNTTKTLEWNVNLADEHGIDRLPFGTDGILSLKCAARSSVQHQPKLAINSNTPLTFKLVWDGGTITTNLKSGITEI